MEQYKLGDLVMHSIDTAPFKVVGIREDEIEIEGDFSGGTHNVCQQDWVLLSEVTPYQPIEQPSPSPVEVEKKVIQWNNHAGYSGDSYIGGYHWFYTLMGK